MVPGIASDWTCRRSMREPISGSTQICYQHPTVMTTGPKTNACSISDLPVGGRLERDGHEGCGIDRTRALDNEVARGSVAWAGRIDGDEPGLFDLASYRVAQPLAQPAAGVKAAAAGRVGGGRDVSL